MVLGAGAGLGWLVATTQASAQQAQRHNARVEDLIARMTLEEKAGQLGVFGDRFRNLPGDVNPTAFNPDQTYMADMIRSGRMGGLFNGYGAEQARYAQRLAVEESRLGIPLIYAADIIHGFKTVFPIPLGETASFEPDLAERTARVAAVEGAASGIHQTYAPMVDVGRDQRWGRVAEGAGEDVLLNERFARARVKGFQGSSLAAHDSLLATPKHFAAYGAAEGGMDYNTTDMSEATLRGVYLPPFKAALDAGALSVMSAFNAVNGVPASGNHELLTGVLHDEWSFAGFVVSDYTSERELIPHGFAVDDRDATRVAFLAGVDVSMQSGLYNDHLPGLVRDGLVPMARLDQAVRRVLRVKAALGLFDNPYKGMDPAVEAAVIGAPAHHEVARDAARRSIVLLKNDGGLLPLSKHRTLALIGPFGDEVDDVFGPWTIWGDHTKAVSVAEGLRRAMGPTGRLLVERGSGIETGIPGGVEQAVAAARQADVVILSIGESAKMSGEAQARTEIVVPAPQQALAEAIAATGKPVVVLLRHGRALALEGAVHDAPAILAAWFLGSQTGTAVADVLFGDYSPSGRLPVSFPHRPGQQPFYYNHMATGRPEQPGQSEFKARYRETSNTALFPFGHGLTYGQARYADLRLSSETLAWAGQIEVSATITNAGSRAIEEVVQLYIRDRVASRVRPVRELKDFQKIALRPGESRQVRFVLRREQLEFIGGIDRPTVEAGQFDVWIAPSATEGLAGLFTLQG
ncbi:MAG: beta-glucosidase [Brevundimonas sp.]|nr:MAG: beta-glucosidase [Brevundimonas sp.]